MILSFFIVVSCFYSVLSDNFALWFQDQRGEIIDQAIKLPIQFYNGHTKLPASLMKRSSLIRLGPSILETKKANYTNYIDGFGRISKWSFGNQEDSVFFQSAIIKSALWNSSDSGSDIPPHITSEKVNPSRLEIVQIDNMDNTDVFPYRFKTKPNEITLGTDFYQTNQIDYQTLRTVGPTQFNDDGIKGTFSSSHSAEYIDQSTMKSYRVNWLGQKDLTGTSIQVFKMGDDFIRHVVGSYHINYLPYSVHTVMVVDNYAILYISPVKLKFLATGFDACISCSISDKLNQEDSQFIIFDLKSQDPKTKPISIIPVSKTNNFFVFHYANGKLIHNNQGNSVIELDTCSYNTMDGVLGEHVLGNLQDISTSSIRDNIPYFCNNLKRIQLDLKSNSLILNKNFPLQDNQGNQYHVELLSMNNHYYGKDYCYIYGLTAHVKGSSRYEDMGIAKVNICKANQIVAGSLPANEPTVEVFSMSNMYVGEPIFVPNYDKTTDEIGNEEDNGHLLVISRDGNENKTKLLIIDAKTMSLVASVTSPLELMFEFHGAFFSDE